ncbi:MAG: DUF455 domain-containing protein [Chlamydiae bacterium CG10_big_fil_rev_8_21_14_0_10_42_34]|nr:MAG: DUF455 domain-containing protein [Chlamydiae bacterium CG10_big_fil_rev_8_21_14_0_10_42_34]
MELRQWAIRILSADTLEEKLFCPDHLSDDSPGEPLTFNEPIRPIGMGFNKRTKEQKLPHFQNLNSEDNRAVCLHRFAGHELLAVEIMAHALTAFPDAPKAFRKGIAHTLKEEQGHVLLYMKRMEEMGLKFGELPLFKHFWNHVPYLTSPIRYVSVMSLTFEMANLDFAPLYGRSFAGFGDNKSATLMAQILKDEINHVSFGYSWLNKFKGENSAWDSWISSLHPKLSPKRAKGFTVFEENRKKASIPDEWIEKIKLL